MKVISPCYTKRVRATFTPRLHTVKQRDLTTIVTRSYTLYMANERQNTGKYGFVRQQRLISAGEIERRRMETDNEHAMARLNPIRERYDKILRDILMDFVNTTGDGYDSVEFYSTERSYRWYIESKVRHEQDISVYKIVEVRLEIVRDVPSFMVTPKTAGGNMQKLREVISSHTGMYVDGLEAEGKGFLGRLFGI